MRTQRPAEPRKHHSVAERLLPGFLPFLAVLFIACGPTEPERARPPSFILIVVDALRADHLAEDESLDRFPNLSALRKRSVRFRAAYAASSWTLPSVASMLLSLHGSEHRVVTFGSFYYGAARNVAQVFDAAGYATAGRSANGVIVNRGLERGFDDFRIVRDPAWRGAHRPWEPTAFADGEQVSRSAVGWLRNLRAEEPERPFFLYAHFMEPHVPLRCPVRADAKCGARAEALNRRLVNRRWDFSQSDATRVRELYNAELERLDHAVGILLSGVSAEADAPLVVLTADHGELLGENGLYSHGFTLDQELVNVPLWFAGPGLQPGVVDERVSLIDVAPTLLEIGSLAPPVSFRGRSLAVALRGKSIAEVPIVAELFEKSPQGPRTRDRLLVMHGDRRILISQGGTLTNEGAERGATYSPPRGSARDALAQLLGSAANSIDLDWDALLGAPEPGVAQLEELRTLGYVE